MIYEAYYLNGDVVQCDVDYDPDSAEITEFLGNLDYKPEYAILEDDGGVRHPAMSWFDFKEKGAYSNDFKSPEEFEEWLVAVAGEYEGCVTPVALFKESIAPYERS